MIPHEPLRVHTRKSIAFGALAVLAAALSTISIAIVMQRSGTDVRLVGTSYAPLVLVGGHPTPVPDADGIAVGDLEVARTVSIGSDLGAGQIALDLQSSNGTGYAPLDVRESTSYPNTWDFSVMTGSDTAAAGITVFENTPTNGSNDGSLRFKIVPGTGAVGGIELSPNGTSYFDPGQQTNHDPVLAIGFEGAQYMLDVRDFHTGSYVHPTSDCVYDGAVFSCRLVNAVGDNPFATGAGSAVENIMVHGEALAARDSGTSVLTDIGGDFSAANGTVNIALRTRAGIVQIDGSQTLGSGASNTTRINGSTSMVEGSSALSADPDSLSIESDDPNFINFITPSAYRAGLNFDNASNQGDGYIQYGTTSRNMIIGVANATKLTIASALATFAVNVEFDQDLNGHRIGHNAPSGVNHGSLSTGSTDWIGDITGIGANTTVVLTYGAAFSTRSRCQVTMLTQGVLGEYIIPTPGASSVTFSCFTAATGVAANCNDLTYTCTGQ